MENIKFSKGSGNLGVVNNTIATWPQLSKALTTHKQADEKGGAFFVGGYYKSNERKEENLIARSLLTLDIDKVKIPVNDIEFDLTMSIDCAFCAYSTWSHGVDSFSSVRVVVPLSREVTASEYRTISRKFADTLNIKVDECSFKPNQVMFTPACRDVSVAWSMCQEGDALNVENYIDNDTIYNDADNSLELSVINQPLDIERKEIEAYLLALHSVDLDYSDWLTVGAALHHQFSGNHEGLGIWIDWSKKDKERFDEKVLELKWNSFGNSTRVLTFASVIYLVKEKGGLGDEFTNLLTDSQEIFSLSEYDDFVSRVSAIPDSVLTEDKRDMLAHSVHNSFAKQNGVSKPNVKKALKASKKKAKLIIESTSPSWGEEWIYIESMCKFYHTTQHYSILKEAFNAKFNREIECFTAKVPASVYVLDMCKMETVVDTMFFPGADRIFTYENMKMINTYNSYTSRYKDVVIDDEYNKVISDFLNHLEMTLPNEVERTILLDWICYVCQNPGKRVNWAVVLQGAQGTGKTYFSNVLQNVLGSYVQNLDPTSIAGRFTGWAHGSIVNVVEEIRIAGANRFEVLDKMKPYLTNDTVMIEEKGRDHRTVPNFTSYLLLTNHKDAIPVLDGDRRYCVLFSKIQSEKQLFRHLGGKDGVAKYFKDLFLGLRSRPDAIANYILTRAISPDFDPHTRAPVTESNLEMIQLAYSYNRQLMEDLINDHNCEVINDEIIDITYLNDLTKLSDDQPIPPKSQSAVLLEMGYKQITGRKRRIKNDNRYHYVWIEQETDEDYAIEVLRKFYDKSLI